VELLRDLFDLPISVGTIHNRLQSAADKAAAINLRLVCNPSGTAGRNIPGKSTSVGGVDAKSTYCYLLAAAEHRDEDTWGVHLLDASQQGLSLTTPLLTLRKDSELGKQQLGRRHPVMEIFFTSSIKAKNWLALSRRAAANSRRQKLEQEMHKAKLQGRGHTSQPKWSSRAEPSRATCY